LTRHNYVDINLLCQLIAPTRGQHGTDADGRKFRQGAQRVMKSMLQMGKIDIAALKRAQAA
jgi:hypothetical protein